MRTRIAVALGAAVLALAGGVACGGGATPTPTPAPTSRPTTTPTKTPPPTVSATPPSSDATASASARPISLEQQNAARTAQDYLDGQGFSHKGLITQLKYEGYSTKDATAAVNSLHVDWYAQAVIVAKSYLGSQAFSRSGLIKQLEYEGFSAAQAAHGAKGAGL
jgi:hypothetical protein